MANSEFSCDFHENLIIIRTTSFEAPTETKSMGVIDKSVRYDISGLQHAKNYGTRIPKITGSFPP
jgi:hypothetical protein